jgi:ABC-type transport system involved in multi-copper enzyme maturation permease subunit
MIPGFTPPSDVSAWQTMIRDREHGRILAGRVLDADFLVEASEVISKNHPQLTTHYNRILNFLVAVLAPTTFNRHEAMERMPISQEFAEGFYVMRHELVMQEVYHMVEVGRMSENAGQEIIRLDAQISTPFLLNNTLGFEAFILDFRVIAMLLFFVIAICIAPLFAGEHSTGVAQLILVSKHGKRQLIWAKIITAISFCVVASLLFTSVCFLISTIVFGADGREVAFQMLFPWTPYPMNMGQVTIILVFNTILRALLFGAVLSFLSARLKSSFAVMIVASIWIISAVMLYIPIPVMWLYNLARLVINVIPDVPFQSTRFTFSVVPYEIFGWIIPPFVFEPLFSLLVGLVIVFLAGRIFKRYQVG